MYTRRAGFPVTPFRMNLTSHGSIHRLLGHPDEYLEDVLLVHSQSVLVDMV